MTTLAGTDTGLGLITESLLKDLRIGRVALSTINLYATLIGALFVFPTGRLIDRFGSRAVLTAILIPLGATVLYMSRATTSGELWAAEIILSILAQSALSVGSMALVGKWFGKRLPLAIVGSVFGILVVIGYIAAFQAFGSAIAEQGWRAPWRVFGTVILCAVAPLTNWLLVRATPEIAGIAGEFTAESKTTIPGMTWRAALGTSARFWLFGLAQRHSSAQPSTASGVFLGESILHERGFDAGVRIRVLSIQTAAGLLCEFRGYSGWFRAARIARENCWPCPWRCWPPRSHSWRISRLDLGVLVYATLMGVAGGAITVLFFAIWAHAFGRAHLGKIQGIAQGLCIVAGAFGPISFARIQAASGSYAPALYAGAACCTAFSIWAWFVRVPRAGGVQP